MKPDHARAHYNLGNILRDQGDPKGAMVEFRRAVEIDPLDYEGHYNLGLLLKSHGQRDEAIQEFREFLRVIPNEPEHSDAVGRARKILHELGGD